MPRKLVTDDVVAGGNEDRIKRQERNNSNIESIINNIRSSIAAVLTSVLINVSIQYE